MCGIAGIHHTQAIAGRHDVVLVHSALDRLAHRGPDDDGSYQAGGTVLGHRRLSIIDTSDAGHQPFTDENGRHTIVFNGEVFNYRELRAGLEAAGHTFRSRSDTEVLLRLFTLKGPDFLHDLNGFFALAIHDRETGELFLARDRFGIKPLLWAHHGATFRFASELGALEVLGALPDVDRASLAQYLTFHHVPAPHTILTGARRLLPGHRMTVGPKGISIERWYDLASVGPYTGPDPASDLKDLLQDAVRLRLIADVPVGCYLSGGLDSSIISALAARSHPQLRTFSIGYTEDPWYDESAHAEEVARHIGSDHTTFRLSREDLAEAYPRLLASLSEPFADSSALPSFLLAERTRREVKVALSGDGADEVFGGYRKHQAELRWRAPGALERAVVALAPVWRNLPRSRESRWGDAFRKLDRFASLSGAAAEGRYLALAAFEEPGVVEDLLRDRDALAGMRTRSEAMVAPLTRAPGLNGVLLADVLHTLPNDMLHKVDVTSMAHGLEVRPPFLDRRVVELAFGLPDRVKFERGEGKALLRRTFGGLLPEGVLTRRKRGFEVPLAALFAGPLRSLVDDLTTPDHVAQAGLSPAAVKQVIASSRTGRNAPGQATVHALLVYLSWWRRTVR